MPEVRITVPAEHAELFKREAAYTLEFAANGLNDELRFRRRGRSSDGDVTEARARLSASEALHDQARDQGGTLLIDGDADRIATTLEGCVLTAAEEVHDAAEYRRGPETRGRIRRTLANVELWLGLQEQVEQAVGVEAVSR